MNSIAKVRTEASELQNMHIVVAHGVRDDIKDMCAIGWVEDKPHEDGEAIVLNEPLYCIHRGAQLRFIGPSWGVPLSTEIFDYTRIDVYEGVTSIAASFIQCLLKAREYVPPLAIVEIIPEASLAPVPNPPKAVASR